MPFKVADRYRWIVVLGGHQHIEELRKAPDDELSFHHASNDVSSNIVTERKFNIVDR